MGVQHLFYVSSLARTNSLSHLCGLQTIRSNGVKRIYEKTTSIVRPGVRSGISHLYNLVGVKSCEDGLQKTILQNAFGPSSNSIFRNSLQTCKQSNSRQFSTFTALTKDVVLFEHDRTTFFRLLAMFCGGQVIFWTYLAHFAFTGLRDTGGNNVSSSERKLSTTGLAGLWSLEMNLGSAAWRYGFTLACLAIGGGIAGLGAMFCRRAVCQVILHKGGGMVTVSTQSPLGADKGRRIYIPLSSVTCHAHRHESPSFIPLRIKGHKFYFLLDKEGTLNNPKLFDVTVGAYRPF